MPHCHSKTSFGMSRSRRIQWYWLQSYLINNIHASWNSRDKKTVTSKPCDGVDMICRTTNGDLQLLLLCISHTALSGNRFNCIGVDRISTPWLLFLRHIMIMQWQTNDIASFLGAQFRLWLPPQYLGPTLLTLPIPGYLLRSYLSTDLRSKLLSMPWCNRGDDMSWAVMYYWRSHR
jgi:hypothetical protein